MIREQTVARLNQVSSLLAAWIVGCGFFLVLLRRDEKTALVARMEGLRSRSAGSSS